MVRIQLDIPEDERRRFATQAAREGKTLDAWLLAAARQRTVEPAPEENSHESEAELWAFLREHSGLDGPEREPDWDEHLRNLDASIREGLPEV